MSAPLHDDETKFSLLLGVAAIIAGLLDRLLTIIIVLGVIAFILAFVVGCNETPTAPTQVAPVEPPAPAPLTLTRRPDVAWDVFRLTNEARAQGGTCDGEPMPPVRRVTWDYRLAAAAERHALDTAEHDELGHTGTDGSTPQSRARDAGYAGRVGENASFGANPASWYNERGAARLTVEGWLDSPGHCRNLLNARWRHVGVAKVEVTGGSPDRFWWTHTVQLFGAG